MCKEYFVAMVNMETMDLKIWKADNSTLALSKSYTLPATEKSVLLFNSALEQSVKLWIVGNQGEILEGYEIKKVEFLPEAKHSQIALEINQDNAVFVCYLKINKNNS